MASTDPEHKEEHEIAAGEEEDTGAQVAPIVRLEEVAVTTGEENEDAILDLKSKLYRFDKEAKQWKERGVGTVKLLKHRETGKVRLVMRQSKTLKICANHLVIATTSVQEHSGNDKSCVWHASDYADGELKDELFCIRFPSIENCKSFKEKVNEIAEAQQEREEEGEGNNDDANAAAELLENLAVVEDAKEKEDENWVVVNPVKEEEAEKKAVVQEDAASAAAADEKKVEEPPASST